MNESKQYMKQHILTYKFICLIAMVVFLGSCRKSLTVDQENNTVEEGYYNSAQRIQQSVIGGYVDLRRALFANYAWMMYGEARTGDMRVSVAYQDKVVNQELTAGDRNITTLSDWSYFYDVIKDANDALDIIAGAEEGILNTYQKNTFRGEALALKSLAYFYLARIWGSVPSAEANNFGTKLTSQEAVAQAIVYATEAQNLVPWLMLNDDGIESRALTVVRFNRTAVTSLLAQEQLWLGNGEAAYNLLTNTVTSSTTDSLSTFGLAVGADRRTEIPTTPLTSGNVRMPLAKFNAIYPQGDTRRSSMFNVSASTNTATLIIFDASFLELLGYSELILLQAEAAWRSGHIDEAKDYLIEAAEGATEDYSTLTEETFGPALLLERQRLLVGKGQRMFDLIRFNEVPSNIPAFTEEDVVKGAAYWPLSANSMKGNGWSQNAYWAIP